MTSLHSAKLPPSVSKVWTLAPQLHATTEDLGIRNQDVSPLEVKPGRTRPARTEDGGEYKLSLSEEASRPVAHVQPDLQRNFAEGVIIYADGKTVLCAITSLDGEPKVALPQALFPIHPGEGLSFRIRMSIDEDGFRTPAIEMAEVQPSERVAAIHREIDDLMATF